MSANIKISDDVMSVLKSATIEGNSLVLNGQLDRGLYTRTNAVLEAAGGKWNRKAKAHVFPSDPKEILGLAMEEGEILNKKQAFQQFYTPKDLAKRMVQMAGVKRNMVVLEPSAGEGAIADEIYRVGGKPLCVELDEKNIEILEKKKYTVIGGNFLFVSQMNQWSEESGFKAIVMNPPFTKDQDIDHVRSAFNNLAPGGTLVAIMSPGFTFGTQSKRAGFRSFVEENGEYEKLPDGTFKESGTNVSTVLVTLRKPK